MATRRTLLERLLAGGVVARAVRGGPTVAAEPAGAEGSGAGFVDAHVHVWTPDLAGYPLAAGFDKAALAPPSFTAEELLAVCRPLGVSRVVLIQMNFYGFDNRYMLDCMERHPGVFGGVAVIDHEADGAGDEMRRLADRGVRGFRLYADAASVASWPDSPAMRAMWARGADDGLAMCLLADPDALEGIARMCAAFPQTPVVIDHFARIGMRGPIDAGELAALVALADHPRVFVKTSAFYALGAKRPPYDDLEPMIRRLRDAFGARRLMWATDGPYQLAEGQGYEASLAVVRDRCHFLTAAERAEIVGGTAGRLFFG
jgi:predicted TIM-barrel fold metal-dependent hydrolase